MQREIAVSKGLIHGKRSVALLNFSRLLPESSGVAGGRLGYSRVWPSGPRTHIRCPTPPGRIYINCLVMPKLTTEIPNFKLPSTSFPIPSHISLADPQYYIPRDVELIIGNGYLWDLMSVGQHRLGAKLPVLLKTQLGWVLAVRIRTMSS